MHSSAAILAYSPVDLSDVTMAVNRLFSPVRLSAGAAVCLDDERAHYAGRVLRLKPGSELTLFDGTGGEYASTVVAVSGGTIRLETGAYLPRDTESPLQIHLVQGVSRGDRMDFVVQKATELGAVRVSPVLTERSVVRLDAARASRRRDHWIGVARSACEQCGRNVVPEIDPPVAFASWFEANADGGCRLMPMAGADGSIASVARPGRRVTLLVGPEGGLSTAEARQAAMHGFEAVSLGPRVLRTETAALTAVAVIQSHFGDL